MIVFFHDESDVTMVSFLLDVARSDQRVIRMLSDDTDVFVLLVHWVNRTDLQCKIQMDHWDGSVLNIKATCTDLGQKCLQLLDMHALSSCDTTSCLNGKAKLTALNTMVSGIYQGLATIGDVGTTHTELIIAAMLSLLIFFTVSHQEQPWNLLATIYSQR